MYNKYGTKISLGMLARVRVMSFFATDHVTTRMFFSSLLLDKRPLVPLLHCIPQIQNISYRRVIINMGWYYCSNYLSKRRFCTTVLLRQQQRRKASNDWAPQQNKKRQQRLGWLDVTGLAVADRLAVEERLLVAQQQQQQQDDRRQLASLLLVVGHSHRNNKDSSSSFVVHPSSLWTTTIASPNQQQQQSTTTSSNNLQPLLLPLYQAMLQRCQSHHDQKATAGDKPRKTLIMESKACCGIGTTGKILSLQEIQTKQDESRPKRRLQQEQAGLVYYSDEEQWKWQDQVLATTTMPITTRVQRTAWHWHQEASSSCAAVDMSTLFPSVSAADAMDILEETAAEMYQLQDLSDYFNNDDDMPQQAHQEATF